MEKDFKMSGNFKILLDYEQYGVGIKLLNYSPKLI